MEPQVRQEFNSTMEQTPGAGSRNRNDARHTDYKSPALAGFLSILPGLGQVYVGYYKQGFMYVLIYAFTIAVLTGSGVEGSGLEPLGAIFLAFFFFFNIIDAVRRARLFNRVVDGVAVADLPPDFELPTIRGSISTGLMLIFGGSLLFLHTMFDVSLAWLQDWWPLVLIGFGAWLVYKDVSGRRKMVNPPGHDRPAESEPADTTKIYRE